jgi:hypothetical protein
VRRPGLEKVEPDLETQHAPVPGLARETIGFLPRLLGALCRGLMEAPYMLSRDFVPIAEECAEPANVSKPLRLVDWGGKSLLYAAG